MPIYEYQCPKCGNEFEEWQRITDPGTADCPNCGGVSKRLISHSSFILKGTGWYVTDYARKNGGSAPSSEKKSTEAKSNGSETTSSSTETKTTKTESKPSAGTT